MTNYPIHENLSTSFVNLRALIVHLRRLQFVGSIRVEMSSYEADIIINGSNPVRAREYDLIAGRLSQGEHAFRRILARSRDPFGRIHVYPEGHEKAAAPVFVDKAISAGARQMAAGRSDRMALHAGKAQPMTAAPTAPDPTEWETLLDLTGELLRTMDRSLGKANLNFPGAFKNACTDLAEEYPFLDPASPGFTYEYGDVRVNGFVDPKFFVSGICAALRIVMARLHGRPHLARVYNFTITRLRALAADHSRLCERFGLSGEIEKLCREP